MNNLVIEVNKDSQVKIQLESFGWKDNPHIQKLLEIVASIIAQEYIQIAKQNPDVFSNNGGKK
jgi:hypothetical protein